jgi:hypothetical protein
MSGTTTIPNDPNPGLRTQYMADLAVLMPQIKGLQGLATTILSPPLLAQINEQIAARQRRQTLIQNVLHGLDAVIAERELLDADGYPALPAVPLIGSLFSELQEENSALEAAVAVFTSEQIAAGTTTFSPNPNPPTQTGP